MEQHRFQKSKSIVFPATEVVEDGYSFTINNVVTFRYGGKTAVNVNSQLQTSRKSVGVAFNIPDAVSV